MLFDALDLAATFVFAISGATHGVRKRLDLFGVLVGRHRPRPPDRRRAAGRDQYFAITIAAGLVGFFASAQIARLKTPVQLFAAAGLCLFAVTGTEKALAGAGSIALGFVLGLPAVPVMVFRAGLCLFLRLMSLYRSWCLPSSQSPKETEELR